MNGKVLHIFDREHLSSLEWWLGAFMYMIVAFELFDLAEDYVEGQPSTHLILELGIVFLALVLLLLLRRRAGEVAAENLALKSDLHDVQKLAQEWRAKASSHIQGLSSAIDAQFSQWGFTPSECEIARLLLKGLGLKEIASQRGTSERTVRQQSLGIYTKSGLAGRAELAAFFLEDLLHGKNQ